MILVVCRTVAGGHSWCKRGADGVDAVLEPQRGGRLGTHPPVAQHASAPPQVLACPALPCPALPYPTLLCSALLCCAVLCCALLCPAMSCYAALHMSSSVLCRVKILLSCAGLCCTTLGSAALHCILIFDLPSFKYHEQTHFECIQGSQASRQCPRAEFGQQ